MVGLVYEILKIPPDRSDEIARNLDLFNRITSRGAARRGALSMEIDKATCVTTAGRARDSSVEAPSKNKASDGRGKWKLI